jgi:hypothetical protein
MFKYEMNFGLEGVHFNYRMYFGLKIFRANLNEL